MQASTVYLSHEPGSDRLFALPYGATSDGQPAERWRELSDEFAFYLDPDTDAVVGFGVEDFSELDLDADPLAEIWTRARFTAPLLGLRDVPAGEIILAARSYFGDWPSLNRIYFDLAVNTDGVAAIRRWTGCLESGDPMAHFGLGYTLYELGRFHEAYRHLRYYTELAPAQPWVWCWFGKAAEALGETDEAWNAYVRAIELTEEGGDETEAPDLLPRLRG